MGEGRGLTFSNWGKRDSYTVSKEHRKKFFIDYFYYVKEVNSNKLANLQ